MSMILRHPQASILVFQTLFQVLSLCAPQGSPEMSKQRHGTQIYIVVNFFTSVNFYSSFVLGYVMYANEFETKEKQKWTGIKN